MHASRGHALQVILPHTHFNDDETNALQDPDTVQEVVAMRQSHEACFTVSQAQCHGACCNIAGSNMKLPLEST